MADSHTNLESVNRRYSDLASESSSLSCGSYGNFQEARAGSTCADLGCGRGGDVIRLARRVGANGYVYGIDVSDGMVEAAGKTLRESGIGNAEIVKCSLEQLSLEDESIDLVVSNCTINHAENKENVWREIFRVLKNNGEFIVNDIYSMERIPERYSSDPEAVADCWAGAVTRNEYLKTVESAGFINMTISGESSPYMRGEALLVSFTIKGRKP